MERPYVTGFIEMISLSRCFGGEKFEANGLTKLNRNDESKVEWKGGEDMRKATSSRSFDKKVVNTVSGISGSSSPCNVARDKELICDFGKTAREGLKNTSNPTEGGGLVLKIDSA